MIATSGFEAVDWALLAIIVVLLAGSGFLALAETSLVRTSRVRARALVDDERRGSRQLAALVERPETFLNPVLLLVLICQLVSATLVGVLASSPKYGVVRSIRASYSVLRTLHFVFLVSHPSSFITQHSYFDPPRLWVEPW